MENNNCWWICHRSMPLRKRCEIASDNFFGGRQALCVMRLEGRVFLALAAVVHGEVGALGVAPQRAAQTLFSRTCVFIPVITAKQTKKKQNINSTATLLPSY